MARLPKTSVAYPFVLFRSGEGAKLAYLTIAKFDAATGKLDYTGHTMNRHWSKADWGALYKTHREISSLRVIKEWRHAPSADAVKFAAERFNKMRATVEWK